MTQIAVPDDCGDVLRFFAFPRSRPRLAGFGLLLGMLSCGRLEHTAEPPPLSIDTPWLVVRYFEDLSYTGRPVHAVRMHGGEIESVALENRATGNHSWSQSGRWMTYSTEESPERLQWVRRFDGQAWSSPQLVGVHADFRSMRMARWAPEGDALLLERRSPAGTEISVVRPRDDGPPETKVIATGEPAWAGWAPLGDSILLRYGNPNVTRLSVVRVPAEGSAPDAPWPSREIRAPEGESFDRLDSHPDESPLAEGTLSTDGRFIVFVTKGVTRQLRAFSTGTDMPPRALEGCAVSREDAPGDTCRPRQWIPGTTTLLLERLGPQGKSVDAWDVETGSLRSLGPYVSDGFPGGSRRVWMVKDANPPYQRALIDLEDIATPRSIGVPDFAQRSLRYTNLSPARRWLLLQHRSESEEWINALDIRGGMVDATREVYRRPRTDSTELRPFWSANAAVVLVAEVPAGTKNNELERVTRIELDAQASSTLAIPKEAHVYLPQSGDALGPDGRAIVLRRNEELVLWQWGTPLDAMRPIHVPTTAFSWAGIAE